MIQMSPELQGTPLLQVNGERGFVFCGFWHMTRCGQPQAGLGEGRARKSVTMAEVAGGQEASDGLKLVAWM